VRGLLRLLALALVRVTVVVVVLFRLGRLVTTAISVVFDCSPPRQINHAHDTPRTGMRGLCLEEKAHRQAETKTPRGEGRRVSCSDAN
jgi:hypothetical protein